MSPLLGRIASNLEGLKECRKLSKGELDLQVGNGAKVVALAYSLSLLSALFTCPRSSKTMFHMSNSHLLEQHLI